MLLRAVISYLRQRGVCFVVFSTVRTASIIEKMVWEDVSAVSQDFLPLPAGRKKSYICNVGLPRGKPSTDGDP